MAISFLQPTSTGKVWNDCEHWLGNACMRVLTVITPFWIQRENVRLHSIQMTTQMDKTDSNFPNFVLSILYCDIQHPNWRLHKEGLMHTTAGPICVQLQTAPYSDKHWENFSAASICQTKWQVTSIMIEFAHDIVCRKVYWEMACLGKPLCVCPQIKTIKGFQHDVPHNSSMFCKFSKLWSKRPY